jgi:hypothetical protein
VLVGNLANLRQGTFPDGPKLDAMAWQGVSWGLVEGFRNWMVGQGDAVGSINVRLAAVKAYAKLELFRKRIRLSSSGQGLRHKVEIATKKTFDVFRASLDSRQAFFD